MTEVVVKEWFLLFLSTESERFSILSNVDFTVSGLWPLATKEDEYFFGLLWYSFQRGGIYIYVYICKIDR